MQRDELFDDEARKEAILAAHGEDKWGALAERRIQEAMERGEFDNLKGTGKRQGPDEYSNPFIKAEMRMAYSMLRHNGMLPDWAALANEVEGDRERLNRFVEQHFVWLSERMAALPDLPIIKLRSEIERLKAQHNRATQSYRESLAKLNVKINQLNAMVPSPSLAQPTYLIEARMESWQRRTPAYLEY